MIYGKSVSTTLKDLLQKQKEEVNRRIEDRIVTVTVIERELKELKVEKKALLKALKILGG